jgi:hypothetical protein
MSLPESLSGNTSGHAVHCDNRINRKDRHDHMDRLEIQYHRGNELYSQSPAGV